MLKRLWQQMVAVPSPQEATAASPAADRPRVFYITSVDSPRRIRPDEAAFSPQASLRLRVLMPARAIARHADVWMVPLEMALDPARMRELGRPTAWVIGKFTSAVVGRNESLFRELLEAIPLWSQQAAVVADLSDDYAAIGEQLDASFLGTYQRSLLQQCRIVVPCEALRVALQAGARAPITVVEDPYERDDTGAPRIPADGPIRLCWFGFLGPLNAAMLRRVLVDAARRLQGRDVVLNMVTSVERRPLVDELAAAVRAVDPRFAIAFTEWSPQACARAVDEATFVLLPQDPGDRWGSVKSHNRLVEALRGGRLALASPIPSYVEMKDFAWVDDDLIGGIEWALAHPEEALERIRRGQAYVAKRFAPDAVARKWMEAIGIPSDAPAAAVPAPPVVAATAGGPVRLNLGCGDKILDGYVNVDIAASRAGRQPDVVCDLHDLHVFDDGCADEIMAIHVIEHFWRWEVLDVVREWMRVLKPGGTMIIECPNLLAACEAIVRDPAAASGTGMEVQRTMWVLYGDPRWQDPLMCHRWNYTPQSLAALLTEAGLVNVRQEPAQFKMREPRDMRLVGEKPVPG
jgi:hypothetical protein